MAIYTVHVEAGDTSAANARFIREGFSWGALIFGPLWLLAHRLWLAFLVCCLVLILNASLAYHLHLDNGAAMLLSTLSSVYIALEGNQLRRKNMERRGWPMVDIVSAEHSEAAEALFYSRWPAQTGLKSAAKPPQPVQYSGTEILGLFPQKGI